MGKPHPRECLSCLDHQSTQCRCALCGFLEDKAAALHARCKHIWVVAVALCATSCPYRPLPKCVAECHNCALTHTWPNVVLRSQPLSGHTAIAD